MIEEVIWTSLILFVLYVITKCYLIPKRKLESYASLFEAKGYRVLYKPYHPLRNQFYEAVQKNSLQLGDALKVIRQEYPKYDVLVTNLGTSPLVQIFSPDLIQSYFELDKHYSYVKYHIPTHFLSMIIGNGLVSSQGNQWKRKRAVLNKLFNFQFLKGQTYSIAQICDKTLGKSEADIKTNEKGEKYLEVSILNTLIQIVSKVVFTTFLGLETDQKIDGTYIPQFLTKLIDDASRLCFQTTGLIFGKGFTKLGLRAKDRDINRRNELYRSWAMKAIRQKISSIEENLHKNLQKAPAKDIIEAFFLEKQQKSQSITSEEEIFNELSNFLFAGTDTTSHYLEAMIYFIVLNPEVQKKLRQQIRTYMSNDDYSYENLKKMTYIENIQKETTRIYGPAVSLLWRKSKQDNYLGNIPIKKGTVFSILFMRNHLSEQFFVRPNEFRPERWQSQCDKLPNYVFNGFSGGARTCIGKHLALLQSKITLIKFFKKYKKIELPKKDVKILMEFLVCMQKMKVKLFPSD